LAIWRQDVVVFVQIYGVTDVSDAAEVDRLEADHIGIVVDEGIETWDSVDPVTAKAIAVAITRAKVVALSLSSDPRRIRMTADLLEPDIVHLARAHLMDVGVLDRLRASLAPAKMMLTVPIHGPGAVEAAQRLAAAADYLLLDSAHPSTGVVGATGFVHDWDISAAVVETTSVPVILAGGLGPDNVQHAISQVHPAGVDSETRTSQDGDRRRKDLDKVALFIRRANIPPAFS
jgi:phosphoribosylanthranilate isomerase